MGGQAARGIGWLAPGRLVATSFAGLARNFRRRLTEPGTYTGTLDYMAPEQARDSSTAGILREVRE